MQMARAELNLIATERGEYCLVIISAFMLCLFSRMAIRLQSLLTRAAGNWQQHSAWMVRLRRRSLIFKQRGYVYQLSTMKRFTDATLVDILTKMCRSGGCKLTQQEWKALCNTDISKASAAEQRERLRDTEHWYQSAPTWATVSMAQVIRSRLSAVHAAATLFIIPAKDYRLCTSLYTKDFQTLLLLNRFEAVYASSQNLLKVS